MQGRGNAFCDTRAYVRDRGGSKKLRDVIYEQPLRETVINSIYKKVKANANDFDNVKQKVMQPQIRSFFFFQFYHYHLPLTSTFFHTRTFCIRMNRWINEQKSNYTHKRYVLLQVIFLARNKTKIRMLACC